MSMSISRERSTRPSQRSKMRGRAAEGRRLKVVLAAVRGVALVALVVAVSGIATGATVVDGARHTYDVPAVARVAVFEFDGVQARSSLRGGVWGRSDSPSVEVWHASTTSDHQGIATEAAGTRIPWNSYADYPKVTINGREYANVGGRPYTQHAVDRLQPSGLSTPAGASGPGRSIAPAYVDDVLTGSQTVRKPVFGPNGEARVSHVSGSVEVITEGDIVITVITR